MATKSSEEPMTPGPVDRAGGEFVLIGDEPVPEREAHLAMGSDVVDVDTLDRELERRRLDDMLRKYLEDK